MPEDVLFEFEADQSRNEVASYLRSVADKLESGETITLESGGETVSLSPPGTVEFEVKAEREGPAEGSGELSMEFELEWPEDGAEDGERADDGLAIE